MLVQVFKPLNFVKDVAFLNDDDLATDIRTATLYRTLLTSHG